jgi:hypothetical protein
MDDALAGAKSLKHERDEDGGSLVRSIEQGADVPMPAKRRLADAGRRLPVRHRTILS